MKHRCLMPMFQCRSTRACIESGMTVVDLAYRGDGAETPLCAAARERGARVVDGLEVLVGQGIYAFELLTGRAAPVEAMRRGARL